ncbi:ABC transporter ATP-binding protein [Candidatus Woesearchaeota archaeon]|nr:ABC transporter ATP-binding protein [Candidatus Woesearchaeota archaeon]
MGTTAVHALRGLTLQVNKGEFLAVQGPSGSGKSTCMNIVGCLDLPTKGKVLLDGKDIAHLKESDLAQIRGRMIGFVFQKFHLIPTLTAVENVMLPLTFQGVPENKRLDRAEYLLQLVGLRDRMHHKPNELSGGQQQRVAIARALAVDPPVILADEPTGNLDSATGVTVMKLLQELHIQQHKTLVLVTHDNHLASHADRVAYLSDGKIVKQVQHE